MEPKYQMPSFYDGKPAQKTMVGGHPIHYITKDTSILCPQCVGDHKNLCKDANVDEWFVVAHDTNWNNRKLFCSHCNRRLIPAYDETF